MRTTVAILLLILTKATAPISAQTLDLGRPIPPPPESQPALTTLIDRLNEDATTIIARLHRSEIVSDTHDDAEPSKPEPEPEIDFDFDDFPPMLGVELRRLALALAQRGDHTSVLLARTIAAHIAAFDNAPHNEPAAAIRMLVRTPPAAADLDRALRDALAPLLKQPIPANAGWVLKSPVVGIRPIDAAAPDTAHAVRTAVLNAAVDADTEPIALEPSRRARAVRTDAALDIFRPVPRWLGTNAVEAFAAELAALTAPDRPDDTAAHARLDRLAAIASAVRAFDALPASRATRDARAGVRTLLAEMARTDTPRSPDSIADTQAVLAAATRLAAVLADTSMPTDRGRLIAPFRPAWPRLTDQRRNARERALDLVPRVLAMPRPVAEPAFLAMLAEVDAADRALLGMDRVSFVMCGGSLPEPPRRPEPLPRFDDTAARILAVVRALPRRRDGPSPLLPHRSETVLAAKLATAVELLPPRSVRPERGMLGALDADTPERAAWLRLTSNRPNTFVDALGSQRDLWLSRWRLPTGAGGAGSPAAERHAAWVRAAHRWFELAAPAVALAGARERLDAGERSRADAWPGWAMDERLAGHLLRPYEAALVRARVALERGDADAARRSLDRAATSHAAARLAGLIEMGLPDPPEVTPLQAALAELAAGPCDARLARFGPARDAIAEACRWSWEHAASVGDDRALFADLAGDAAVRALRLLGVR